jgi:hypothetical protein
MHLFQVHGRAAVVAATQALPAALKKAASEALLKVPAGKCAPVEVPGVASYAISVSCETSPSEHGSRPSSHAGLPSVSVSLLLMPFPC